MKEYGTIRKILGKNAEIEIARKSSCEKCGACKMGRNNNLVKTTAINTIDAKVGDNVIVEIEFSGLLNAAIIAYGIPLVLFITGIVLGGTFASYLQMDPVLFPFGLGILLTAMSYGAIYLLEIKGIFGQKYRSKITKIINSNDEDSTLNTGI